MMRDDWREFFEWLAWALVFGGMIAGALWFFAVMH